MFVSMKEFIKYLNSFSIRPSKLKLKQSDIDKILLDCKAPSGQSFVYDKRQMYATNNRIYLRGIQIEVVD